MTNQEKSTENTKSFSPTIETYTGTAFDILNPTIEMIDIRDIAHAGSQLCRFTGHTRFFYSIAQHELVGSRVIPEEYALEFLLHDAAESYVNDMSRPLKHQTDLGKLYIPIEDRIQSLIREKFGLPEVQSPIIHEVDNLMLWTEKEQLMGKMDWNSTDLNAMRVSTRKTANVRLLETSPRAIEVAFLLRFRQLTVTTGENSNANHQSSIQDSYVRRAGL